MFKILSKKAFAANEFDKAISLAAKLTGGHPAAPENGARYGAGWMR